MEAVINDMWCDARITKVIPPTQEEIEADEADDEVNSKLSGHSSCHRQVLMDLYPASKRLSSTREGGGGEH